MFIVDRKEQVEVEAGSDQTSYGIHRDPVPKDPDAESADHVLYQGDSQHGGCVFQTDRTSVKHDEPDGNTDGTHTSVDELQVVKRLHEVHSEGVHLILGSDGRSSEVQRLISDIIVVEIVGKVHVDRLLHFNRTIEIVNISFHYS